MPAAAKRATPKKASRKPTGRRSPSKSVRPRAATAARARHDHNRRTIGRLKDALEITQREITSIRGSLGSGGRDLRKDVARLLRDARRDVEKMNRSVLSDLERLQRELSGAAKAQAPPRPAGKPRKAAPRARRGRPT
jgi:hypothetical protein